VRNEDAGGGGRRASKSHAGYVLYIAFRLGAAIDTTPSGSKKAPRDDTNSDAEPEASDDDDEDDYPDD